MPLDPAFGSPPAGDRPFLQGDPVISAELDLSTLECMVPGGAERCLRPDPEHGRRQKESLKTLTSSFLHVEKLVQGILKLTVGHGILLIAVGVDKAGNGAGEEACAEQRKSLGTACASKAAAAVQAVADTVVEQINDLIAGEKREQLPVIVDIVGVFTADQHQGIVSPCIR